MLGTTYQLTIDLLARSFYMAPDVVFERPLEPNVCGTARWLNSAPFRCLSPNGVVVRRVTPFVNGS